MKQPLVKEVDMTETLKCLFGAVNRATGEWQVHLSGSRLLIDI